MLASRGSAPPAAGTAWLAAASSATAVAGGDLHRLGAGGRHRRRRRWSRQRRHRGGGSERGRRRWCGLGRGGDARARRLVGGVVTGAVDDHHATDRQHGDRGGGAERAHQAQAATRGERHHVRRCRHCGGDPLIGPAVERRRGRGQRGRPSALGGWGHVAYRCRQGAHLCRERLEVGVGLDSLAFLIGGQPVGDGTGQFEIVVVHGRSVPGSE